MDLKTATLFRTAAVVGALLSDATKEELKKIEELWTFIGYSFQLRDDLLSIISTQEEIGKTGTKTDIDNRIQNFIVIKARKTAEGEEKEKLIDYFINKKDYDVKEIRSTILATQAVEETKKEISNYIHKAKEIVRSFPPSKDREKLLILLTILENSIHKKSTI